jgi:hypothetical protein
VAQVVERLHSSHAAKKKWNSRSLNYKSKWIFFSEILGFELLARQALFQLSHTTSHVLFWVFLRQVLSNYLPRLASNFNPPDFCLPSS